MAREKVKLTASKYVGGKYVGEVDVLNDEGQPVYIDKPFTILDIFEETGQKVEGVASITDLFDGLDTKNQRTVLGLTAYLLSEQN